MYSINDKRVPAVTQRARHGNVRPTIDIAINAQCMLGLGAAVQASIYMSHYIYTDLDVKGVVSKSNKTKISERRRLFSRVYCSCARKFDFFLWIKSNLRFNTANVKHWQATSHYRQCSHSDTFTVCVWRASLVISLGPTTNLPRVCDESVKVGQMPRPRMQLLSLYVTRRRFTEKTSPWPL